MSARHLTVFALTALMLSACADKEEHSRIKIGARSGTVAGLGLQSHDGKSECVLAKDGCLNLSLLNSCLKGQDNQVARLATTSLDLFNVEQDVNKSAPLSEQKTLARLMAQEQQDIKVVYAVGRLKDLREGLTFLNVESQNKCESVTVKDGAGNTRVYTIQNIVKSSEKDSRRKGRPSSQLLLLDEKTNHQLDIRVVNGKVLMSSLRLIEKADLCGEKKDLVLRESTELAVGARAQSPLQIAKGLVDFFENHTDASDTLKQALAGQEIKLPQSAKGPSERKVTSRVAIQDTVYADAFRALQSGGLKDIECAAKND